jgi:hypothetical protein
MREKGDAGRSAEQGSLFRQGGLGRVSGDAAELAHICPLTVGDHAAEEVDSDQHVRHRAMAVRRDRDLEVADEVVQAMPAWKPG